MKKTKTIIIFVIFLLIFSGLIILFNIYKKGNSYKNIIKYAGVFISPLLHKKEDIVINRLKSYENTQKEFWIKNSLNDIKKKEKNEEATVNQYLERALIFTEVNKKDDAKEILKNVLLKQKDEGEQIDSIKNIKERIKSGEDKSTEESINPDKNFKDEDINYKLIDMLFEEFIEEEEISFAKELYFKKVEIKNNNSVDKIKGTNESIEKVTDEPDIDVSTSFYDKLKSSDEVKEFIDKGRVVEEYNIVLEVLDKAYEDKFISMNFYNESKDKITKKINDISKNLKVDLANTEEEEMIIKKEEELLTEIYKEEEKVKNVKQWTSMIGSNFSDTGSGLAINEDGIFITGYTYGNIYQGKNNGDSDIFIMKLNFSGELVWSKEFGSTLSDGGKGITTGRNGIFITGYTNGDLDGNKNIGNNDVFITKYDFNGNRVWTRLLGTSEKEKAIGIAIGNDGVYITGNTNGNLDGISNMGTWDVFVTKYDFNGKKMWTRIIGTSNHDEGTGISARGNDVYVTGYSLGNVDGIIGKGNSDVFVIKYNSKGQKLWTRTLGSSESDYSYKISAGLDGIYITGETTGTLDGQKVFGKSDIFIVKYDFDGNKKWTRVLGSEENDYGNSLFVRLDGVYITGGTKGNLGGANNKGGADIFIAKYDFNGTKEFTKLYGTSKDDICNDIIVGLKFFYLTGETTGNLEGKSNNGGSDIFVMMFSDI